jgi:hypothetical protein
VSSGLHNEAKASEMHQLTDLFGSALVPIDFNGGGIQPEIFPARFIATHHRRSFGTVGTWRRPPPTEW